MRVNKLKAYLIYQPLQQLEIAYSKCEIVVVENLNSMI